MEWVHQVINQLRVLPTWTKVLVALISTMLAGAIENAAGNLIDNLSLAGFKALNAQVIPINLFTLLCLVVAPVLIGVLVVGVSLHNQQLNRKNLQWRQERSVELGVVYEKLVNLIASLVRISDHSTLDASMERLLGEFLGGCANIVPSTHILRAVIIRFDSASDSLVPWANKHMPPESIRKICWKLEPRHERTVGAESYLDGHVRLVRFINGSKQKPVVHRAVSGKWVPDKAAYREVEEEKGAKLRYESFVVLPVCKLGESPLAIVCLDSKELDTFSDARIIDVLDRLRQFLVPAIQLYEDLRNSISVLEPAQLGHTQQRPGMIEKAAASLAALGSNEIGRRPVSVDSKQHPQSGNTRVRGRRGNRGNTKPSRK
jgi:hypothetical protein